MKPTVLILGATSGIASAIASNFAADGHSLYLAGRDLEEIERVAADLRLRSQVKVWVGRFDASETAENSAFLERVLIEAGPLAGVVVAIGALGNQETAQSDWAQAHLILDSNFVQVASILHTIAAKFESQRDGWIVALSSVAGDRGRMSNYVYGSAKGGLSVFLQGLRSRLQKVGVHVMTVKPGPVDTAMTFGMDKLPLLADPKSVGASIVKELKKRKDEVYVPSPWRVIMFILKSVPEKIFKKTSL